MRPQPSPRAEDGPHRASAGAPLRRCAGVAVLAALWFAPALAAAKTVVCPGPVTLDGIDVSYWQLDIDWDKVKAAGKKYAIMRAANGLKGDTKFAYNWKRCHELGLRCGVYQYFQPDLDAIQQADLMLSLMGDLKPGDLPPVIDVEAKGNSTPAQLSAAVGKWIAYVEAKTGRQPMIYTGGYFWEDNVKSTAFVDYPLWHAQYCTNCCPNIANPWKKWAFWQYSSTGKVSGINGNVDLNHFNGDAAALDALAKTKGCTPGCKGSIITDATCGQGDCAQFGAYCSTVAAAAPKCVSAFCAPSASSKPTPGDVCLPDGSRATCGANGDLTAKPCPADTSCNASGGAAVCAPTTCKPSCGGDKLVAADCSTKDCAALPAAAAGTCVHDAKGARCKAAACPALGIAAVCLPDPKHLAMGLCQDGAVTVSQCTDGSQVCAIASSGGMAACADVACAPDPKAKLSPSSVCLSLSSLRICDEFGQQTLVDCAGGESCVTDGATALCAAPGGGQGDAAGADAGGGGGPADAGGDASADAGQADGAQAGDAQAGDAQADDASSSVDGGQPSEDASADGASRGDAHGGAGGDGGAGRAADAEVPSDGAIDDGSAAADLLGDAGVQADGAAVVSPARAPAGGCSVRAAGSGALGPAGMGGAFGWLLTLGGLGLALLRRRSRRALGAGGA